MFTPPNRPPYLPIPRQAKYLFWQLSAWIFVVGIWVELAFSYHSLPQKVALHFDLSGKPDRYGNKIELILLPIIATLLTLIMQILAKYPHWYNYPVEITQENAQRIYQNGQFFMLQLAFVLSLVMFIVFTITLRAGYGEVPTIQMIWLIPLLLGLVFLPMVVFLFKVKSKS